MDRIPFAIGKPPSDVWRQGIRHTTIVMMAQLQGQFPQESIPQIRARIIEAARKALGDEPDDPQIGRMLNNVEQRLQDFEIAMEPEALPGMFRISLQAEFPTWRTSMNVESVMAVIQETLDQPVAWVDCQIRESTATLVAALQERGDDPAAIRQGILAATEQAHRVESNDEEYIRGVLAIVQDELAQLLAPGSKLDPG